MSDQDDSHKTLKQDLKSLETGEPEASLVEAFDALTHYIEAAPHPDTRAGDDGEAEGGRSPVARPRRGKSEGEQAN